MIALEAELGEVKRISSPNRLPEKKGQTSHDLGEDSSEEDHTERIRTLEEAMTDYERRISEFEDMVHLRDEEILKLKKTSSTRTQTPPVDAKEGKQSDTTVAGLVKELKAAAEEMEHMKSQLLRLKKKRTEGSSSSDSSSEGEEKEEIPSEKIRGLEARIMEQESEVKILKFALVNREAELEELREAHQAAKSSDPVKDATADLRAELQAAKTQLATLEKSVATRKAKEGVESSDSSDDSEKDRSNDEERADYIMKIETLKGDLRKADKENKEFETAIKKMTAIKTELAQHKAVVDRLGLSYPFDDKLVGSARMKVARLQEL